jgi:hypothetical protein
MRVTRISSWLVPPWAVLLAGACGDDQAPARSRDAASEADAGTDSVGEVGADAHGEVGPDAVIDYFNTVLAKLFKWTYTGRPLRA